MKYRITLDAPIDKLYPVLIAPTIEGSKTLMLKIFIIMA